jgi:DNA-binding Lrp family transcriptional regulator
VKQLSLGLTKFQRQLCNALQDGLAITSRPFAEIARKLDSDEETVLQQTSELKDAGVIRRIRAMIDYRALGRTSTLAAAHVPQEDLPEVTDAVNSLEGVSHNYLRDHFYNLWFTLQGPAAGQIEATLSSFSEQLGIDFHSLPVTRFFKLDVRFDAIEAAPRDRPDFSVPEGQTHRPVPVTLNSSEKLILSKLQDELAIVSEPFAFLCGGELGCDEVLKVIMELIDKGVIRRIAAVVDHRRLGFAANVMFVSEVPPERIAKAGERLARFGTVSHCYERRTFDGWPYNLFAMMHGRSTDQIRHTIDKFVEAERIDSFALLSTAAELKKQPVRYQFD